VDKGKVKTEQDIAEYLRDYSEFERAVHLATFRIPRGKVSTHGRIAKMTGRLKA